MMKMKPISTDWEAEQKGAVGGYVFFSRRPLNVGCRLLLLVTSLPPLRGCEKGPLVGQLRSW